MYRRRVTGCHRRGIGLRLYDRGMRSNGPCCTQCPNRVVIGAIVRKGPQRKLCGKLRKKSWSRPDGQLGGSGQGYVVGAVGNQLVAKSSVNLIIVQEENAWHALDVAGRHAHEVSREPGSEHAKDAFAVHVLPPVRPRQTE